MSKDWENGFREVLNRRLQAADLPKGEEERLLAGVHQKLDERSNKMRFSKKGVVVAIAAAIVVTGTITAVAAGKIASLIGSTNVNEAIHSVAELKEKAEASLGVKVQIPEKFSNGIGFAEGFISSVDALDEEGNKVLSYPEVFVTYGNGMYLNIERVPEEVLSDDRLPVSTKTYQGLELGAYTSDFLFLPPDAQPSEEDKLLEDNGELYISYGTDREERKTFKDVRWMKDGISYMLNTYEDVELEVLVGMAQEVIDAQ